jgi:hypothetical protein
MFVGSFTETTNPNEFNTNDGLVPYQVSLLFHIDPANSDYPFGIFQTLLSNNFPSINLSNGNTQQKAYKLCLQPVPVKARRGIIGLPCSF